MITLAQLLRYLVSGSDELYLPETWLAKTDQLRRYDHWTKRQRYQGSVTADVEAMRRRAFWQHVEAKRQPKGNVARFESRLRGESQSHG